MNSNIRRLSLILFSLAPLVFIGCSDESEATLKSSNNPNILLIIADDMSKDATPGYNEGIIKPDAPNISSLQDNGLTFNNFWTYATCSPTRASIITGKYGYHTGVKWANDILSEDENTLHNYIKTETNENYNTALIGKWHLSGNVSNYNPETFGIDYYAGLLLGAVQDYYSWKLTENGITALCTDYITEKFTNLAIDWVKEQDKPWFLWLAYTAPHLPFHNPPLEMHSQGELTEYASGGNDIPYYMAAIEAMDYQIGRLLNSMSDEDRDNTIIIFIGDNGTPNEVAQSPYTTRTVKGSLNQGGINMPLIISGNGVSRIGTDDNLISSTDLFATIANIAGINIQEINNSKNFSSLLTTENTHRNYTYSELDKGEGEYYTIRNNQFKLIINTDLSEKMYDLLADPYEYNNLIPKGLSDEQSKHKQLLIEELNSIRSK